MILRNRASADRGRRRDRRRDLQHLERRVPPDRLDDPREQRDRRRRARERARQHIISRGSLFLNNSARNAPVVDGDVDENAGKGGGLMSFADGDSLFENTTFSGNKAAVAGGGLFHDADGELRLHHVTIWRNSAPAGGGIGVRESDFVPEVPPKTNAAVILKNSIVGGSLKGGSCDWYVRSEGGNLETGNRNTCFLAVTRRDGPEPDRARRPRPPRRPPAVGDRRQRRADDDARAPVGQPRDRLEQPPLLGRRPARRRAAPERTLRRRRVRVRRPAAACRRRRRRRRSSIRRPTGRSRTGSRRWPSPSAAPTT